MSENMQLVLCSTDGVEVLRFSLYRNEHQGRKLLRFIQSDKARWSLQREVTTFVPVD